MNTHLRLAMMSSLAIPIAALARSPAPALEPPKTIPLDALKQIAIQGHRDLYELVLARMAKDRSTWFEAIEALILSVPVRKRINTRLALADARRQMIADRRQPRPVQGHPYDGPRIDPGPEIKGPRRLTRRERKARRG